MSTTTHLEQEIAQQPQIMRGLLAEERSNIETIAAAIRAFNPAFVSIAARGTSDNAARYAQYLLGIRAGLPVALATPSIHTLYQSPPNLGRALVIGISQSGMSEDVGRVLQDARAQGALTLAITNNADSPLARNAAHHIDLHAGPEISVAATKTYTAELTALAMLASALADDSQMWQAFDALPGMADETVTRCDSIREWAQRYRYMSRFAVIGRGYNYSTAFEITLKVKELCYVIGHSYSEADFLHGPIAIVQSGFPVIVVAPRGETFQQMTDLLKRLEQQQAESIVISDDTRTFANAQQTVHLPEGAPEWLTPIIAVIPGQVFALRLAEAMGHQVDQPRGLTKVTVTR